MSVFDLIRSYNSILDIYNKNIFTRINNCKLLKINNKIRIIFSKIKFKDINSADIIFIRNPESFYIKKWLLN